MFGGKHRRSRAQQAAKYLRRLPPANVALRRKVKWLRGYQTRKLRGGHPSFVGPMNALIAQSAGDCDVSLDRRVVRDGFSYPSDQQRRATGQVRPPNGGHSQYAVVYVVGRRGTASTSFMMNVSPEDRST